MKDSKEKMLEKYLEGHPEQQKEWDDWEEYKKERQDKIDLLDFKRNLKLQKIKARSDARFKFRSEKIQKSVERKLQMLDMYSSGMTLETIGVHFGITREAVRGHIKKLPGYSDTKLSNRVQRAKSSITNSLKEVACANCKKGFSVRFYSNKKYCSKECLQADRLCHPEFLDILRNQGLLAYKNARQKVYYQKKLKNNPIFKEKSKERNKKLSQHLKETGYYKRPDVIQRMHEWAKKRYYEIKADPVKYRQYLDKNNEYCRKRYSAKKLSRHQTPTL